MRLSSLYLLCLLSVQLTAMDYQAIPLHETFVPGSKLPAGTRSLTKEERLNQYEAQVREALENKGSDRTPSDQPKEVIPKPYILISHNMFAKASNSSWIEFEDGTVWRIRWEDRFKIQNWRPTDILDLYQAPWGFFSSFPYRIRNNNINQEIFVELEAYPEKGGTFTRYITGIDYTTGRLVLNDGSRWLCLYKDTSELKAWLLGEIVTTGLNNGWYVETSPFILHNAKRDNYIRVAQE